MAFWDPPETGAPSLATSWPLSPIPLPLPVLALDSHVSFFFFFNLLL